MTALPQATLPLRPRRAEKVLYGRKQRQAHNDAFGNELPGSFDNVPGGMAYKFVGGLGCRTDPTTSLVYMRQRWYDPTLQRFISRDPIGLRGAVNLYAYADASPTTLIDPSGLQPLPIDSMFDPGAAHAISIANAIAAAREGAALLRDYMDRSRQQAKERGQAEIWLENPKNTMKNRDGISPAGGKVDQGSPGSLKPEEWKDGARKGKLRPIPVFYDKFKHCVVACYATMRTKDPCGVDDVGKWHEYRQVVTFTSYDEKDVAANQAGIGFGMEETTRSFGDCLEKCSTKFSPVYFWPYYP